MKTLSSLLTGAATLVYAQEIPPLPALLGDPDSVTISGWNTGATFACMLQVILSDTIKGSYCHKGSVFGRHASQVRDEGTAEEFKDQAAS